VHIYTLIKSQMLGGYLGKRQELSGSYVLLSSAHKQANFEKKVLKKRKKDPEHSKWLGSDGNWWCQQGSL
jgi:hypothetical protein